MSRGRRWLALVAASLGLIVSAGRPSGAYREDRALSRDACEREVEPRKLFVYEFDGFDGCFQGRGSTEAHRDSLRRILRMGVDTRDQMGPALFLRQHLADHPWRTTDPAEAELYVVPSYLDLAYGGMCSFGKPNKYTRGTPALSWAIEQLVASLEASPWYQRNQGRDHVFATLHYKVLTPLNQRFDRSNLTQSHKQSRGQSRKHETRKVSDSLRAQLRHVLRNFVLGMKLARTSVSHRRVWQVHNDLANSCVLRVPQMSPTALERCHIVSEPPGGLVPARLICPQMEGLEQSFEEYLERRNFTIMFAGKPDRDATPNLRAIALGSLATVHPPNILVATTPSPLWSRTKGAAIGKCDNGLVPSPSPCRVANRLKPYQHRALWKVSRFSLHVNGDDTASSRVLEAFDKGTMQLFLSDLYLSDVAAFKCRVPWSEAVQVIGEAGFVTDPQGSVNRALESLYANGYAGMRRMWEFRREAAAELLWHLPNSRAAHNLIEEAIRCLGA